MKGGRGILIFLFFVPQHESNSKNTAYVSHNASGTEAGDPQVIIYLSSFRLLYLWTNMFVFVLLICSLILLCLCN